MPPAAGFVQQLVQVGAFHRRFVAHVSADHIHRRWDSDLIFERTTT